MGLQSGRTPQFTLEIPSFSITSNTTTSTFSRTRKPLTSAISHKQLFSPTPTLLPTLWHPSRPGFFYFSFNDGSLKACQASQKLAIKVITSVAAAATPHASAMPPAPFSGEVSPSPLYPWHYNNPLHAASPGPSPSASVTAPMVPYKSSSMPFISSNPAVPLPTDEVDSASSIHPLPTSSGHELQVMIGSFGLLIVVHTITLLLL
ncbi:hypothetical protein GYH30_045305 [Glycine max]|nr:hypothetical protein GYH30_045305 [Glycine max]